MSTPEPETVKLSSTGQLTIPSAIREALHWEPGTELTLVATGNGVMIQPKRKKTGKRLEDLRGCLKYDGPPISDEVLHAPVDSYDDWIESEKRSR
jgi:AbrB family looped-hinge helix DNA binding protein